MTARSGPVLGGPVLVGPAGWAYADWEGSVYPRPRPRGFDPLRFLAGFVDLVEVNATFYRVPDPRVVATWVERTAHRPAFRFLAKLHQSFTHAPWTGERTAEAAGFRAALAPLLGAGRLDALLVQFPWSFRPAPANEDRLRRLADLFPDVPRVLEVRHREWFEPGPLRLVEALGYALAVVDLPPSPSHPPVGHPAPGPIGYVRLHGRNAAAWFDPEAGRDRRYDWLYGPEALEGIAARIREVAAGGRRTFVVTNNHYRGQAVANALDLKARLSGGTVQAPETLLATFPHLMAIARTTGQQRLF